MATAWDLASVWPYRADFDATAPRPTTITGEGSRGKGIHTWKIGYPYQTYVDAIGLHLAAKFMFVFGGTEVYFAAPGHGKRASALSQVLGEVAADSLRLHVIKAMNGPGPVRLPVGAEFLARYLRSRGEPITRIAPILRTSEVTLRIFLLSDQDRREAKIVNKQKQIDSVLQEAAELGLVEFPSHHKLKPKGKAQ